MTLVIFVALSAIIPSISCGLLPQTKLELEPNWRIVGGSEAALGQFPWQVSIRAIDYGHFCSGSILNSRWILTAAYCVVGMSTESLVVVSGTLSSSFGGNSYLIARIIVHENYNDTRIKNNIAVFELTEEIEFSFSVQPIELQREVIDEVECVVSGWGMLSFDGPLSDLLQFVDLKTMSESECMRWWPPGSVESDEICTTTQDGKGVCMGDSGSALVADGKQIGIVSWGYGCAAGKPDVYTRISSFVDWIEEAISR